MAKKGSIVNQVVEILDEDLVEVAGANSLKRKEIMGALGEYVRSEEIIDPNDGRYFFPDSTIKDLFKEIKVKPEKRMMRASLLKLFGGVARDAGLVDY